MNIQDAYKAAVDEIYDLYVADHFDAEVKPKMLKIIMDEVAEYLDELEAPLKNHTRRYGS